MENKQLNPFHILCDSYGEEASNFYDKLIRKVDFGVSISSTVGQTKQRLLRCAFAYICMEYMHQVADVYAHEDMPLFIEEMQLTNRLPEVYYLMGQAGIKWHIDNMPKSTEIDETLFFELMQYYRGEWGRQLKKTFPIDTDFYELFSDNIFGDYAPTGIDAAGKAMDFIDDLIQ